MTRKWILALVLVLMLVACGGDEDPKVDIADSGGEELTAPTQDVGPPPSPTPVRPTSTPRDPAPRSAPLPQVEPFSFEAPFSVGNFVRQSMQGNVTADRTGGLQASYRFDDDIVGLTVYYFDRSEQAVETVRFVLEGASVKATIEPAYYGPTVAYGVVGLRNNGYLAAWSHYQWAFIVQTGSSVDVLNEYLQSFPY